MATLNTWELMSYERAADKYEALPMRDTTLENRSRFDVYQRDAEKRRSEMNDRYLRKCANEDYAAYKAQRDAQNCPDTVAGECKVDAGQLKKLANAVKKSAVTKKQRRDTLNHHDCFDDLLETVRLNISASGISATIMTIGENRFIPETVEFIAAVNPDAQTFHVIIDVKTFHELAQLLPDGLVTLRYRWMIERLVMRYAGGRARLPVKEWRR